MSTDHPDRGALATLDKQRTALAEAERRAFEARLLDVEAHAKLRIEELEEEVAALFESRQAARALYDARARRLGDELARTEAHRRDLEGLFTRSRDVSEIERARDAATLQLAVEREESVRRRLSDIRAKLARLG
ncbi:MAG TPA: hypothetical protein VL400_06930 [Polyangiaceae bacterium]|jgi:hypothetical protein|nr:hypothetical protein [Polyangiaceae bacterium]